MPLNTARAWIAACAVAAVTLTAVASDSQTDPDPPSQGGAGRQLEVLRARIQAVTDKLNHDRDTRNALQVELANREKEIGRIVQQQTVAASQLQQYQADLTSLKTQRGALRRELGEEQRLLGKQIRASYLMGRHYPLKLILAAEDPKTINRNLIYLDHLNQARAADMRRLTQHVGEIDRLEAAIVMQKQRLETARHELTEKQRLLRVQYSKRNDILAQVVRDIRRKKARLHDLQQDESRLQALLLALRELPAADTAKPQPAVPAPNPIPPFAGLKGRLPMPVTTARGVRQRGAGVMVLAEEGADVRAAAAGRVVFAEWLRGYGLLLILDHGSGYMTLYGHNRSLLRQIQERVDAGDVIAQTGRSGGFDLAGVYFEVRYQGRPQNPRSWIKRGKGDN